MKAERVVSRREVARTSTRVRLAEVEIVCPSRVVVRYKNRTGEEHVGSVIYVVCVPVHHLHHLAEFAFHQLFQVVN